MFGYMSKVFFIEPRNGHQVAPRPFQEVDRAGFSRRLKLDRTGGFLQAVSLAQVAPTQQITI